MLKILGHDWTTVSSTTQEIDTYLNDKGCFGFCDTTSQEIWIATNLHLQLQQTLLLHEIIEAFNVYLELKLEHDAITRLATALYQTLVDSGVDLAPLMQQLHNIDFKDKSHIAKYTGADWLTGLDT